MKTVISLLFQIGLLIQCVICLTLPINDVQQQNDGYINNYNNYDSALSDSEKMMKLNLNDISNYDQTNDGDDGSDNVGPQQPIMSVETNGNDMLKNLKDKIRQDEEVAIKSDLLLKMLEETESGPLPVIYVEDAEIDSDVFGPESLGTNKRSGRYYRRYPWKRMTSRSRNYNHYENDLRHLCVPSREDVFKLLISLHENRNGNHHKTVNFCNRKRPAKAVFTNIRFLG